MRKGRRIYIEKASGTVDLFDETKLQKSLIRAGASLDVSRKVIKKVRPLLFDGVSTQQIYRWALDLLKENDSHTAARYNLKNGIMELGPSGFPFEQFIAALLREEGYSTSVSVTLLGDCISHEIDVIAERNREVHLIECKYHNLQGTLCDVKVPLYIHSRFNDIKKGVSIRFNVPEDKIFGHIYTNTGFTADAIKYGHCVGLGLFGWNHPDQGSLSQRLDQSQLYPITVLNSLNSAEKRRAIEKGIVLCKDIVTKESIFDSIGIRLSRRNLAKDEVKSLCHLY